MAKETYNCIDPTNRSHPIRVPNTCTIAMRSDAFMTECRDTVMIEPCNRLRCIYEWITAHVWMSHGTYMNESRHTYEWVWVTSHIWMSHGTYMNESRHIYEWVSAHIWMSHGRDAYLIPRHIQSCLVNRVEGGEGGGGGGLRTQYSSYFQIKVRRNLRFTASHNISNLP